MEVEIPDLQDHIVATSQYVARTKHDINEFQSTRTELTLNEIVAQGRYHKDLDLIDAVMEGPEDPEDDPDYFRRINARENFTRASVNVMEGRKKWTTLTFPTNTLIASQTWSPAMTVPAGFTADGLPVGLEFVAAPYDEPTVFGLGYAFEQATTPPRTSTGCDDRLSSTHPDRELPHGRHQRGHEGTLRPLGAGRRRQPQCQAVAARSQATGP